MLQEEYYLDRILSEIEIEAGNRILLYFEYHKELLKEKDYNLAYKLAKRAYIRYNLRFCQKSMIEKLYSDDIKLLKNIFSKKYIEKEKSRAEYWVAIVKEHIRQ